MIHGSLALVLEQLPGSLVGVTRRLTFFDRFEVVLVPLATGIEESATSLGGRVKVKAASDVVARTSSSGQATNDSLSLLFRREGLFNVVDKSCGERRESRRRRRLRFRSRILYEIAASRLAFVQIQEAVSVAITTAVIKPLAGLRFLVEIPSDHVISARPALASLVANVA